MTIFIILVILNICFWGGYIIQKIKQKRVENRFWELQIRHDELYNKMKKNGLIK